MSLKSYKEKQYLVFEFEDGKNVKYNLATGESIGKSGRPVKNVCTQLRGFNLLQVIESFGDEKYRDFLKFVDSQINASTSCSRGYSWRSSYRVDKITNIGSFLKRLEQYSIFEQYFACGVTNVDENIKYIVTSIPKGLLKIIREDNLKATNILIESYISNPDLFMNIYNLETNSLSKGNILGLSKSIKYLKDDRNLSNWGYEHYFIKLINEYNYSPINLIKYVDSLITLEALDNNLEKILREINDYARMMSRISEKYDKYPKNFLTTHTIASRNYNRLSQVFREEDFSMARDETLEYVDKELIITYPKTTQDIKDEAVRQNHCVASYIDKVIDGKCHILFLRDKEKLGESLITIEVRDFRVAQARGRFNREPYTKEQEVINKYKKYLTKLKKSIESEKEKND